MEDQRFDDLARTLAKPVSRRQVLKVLVGATVGGLFVRSGSRTAFGAPTCHQNGLGCDTNSQCCSGYCANGEKCTCPPAPACNRYCPCPSGQTCCNGTCTNTLTDIKNCGTCGNACGSTQTCQSGTCVAPPCASFGQACLSDSDCCSGACNAVTFLCQASTCSDGVQNGTETDVDCGGGTCPPCANGRKCLQGGDCASGVCSGGICV